MFNLGFIGGGNMSTAIVNGIIKKDCHPASNIWVSGPHLENLSHWKQLGTNLTTKNGEVFDHCDIIFLGVKPGMLDQAIADILNTRSVPVKSKNVLFVSMLAGKSIDTLKQALRVLKTDFSVIRIMPNTPMMIGEGACVITPDELVTPEQCSIVEKLLSSCCGLCEQVSESLMNSLGSLISCGPAFMYIVIEALADGAVKQGVPRNAALRFASQMVVGSGRMVLQSGKHPGQLKDDVCSPGGSTICGVAALENGKLRASLINAMEAAALKSKELGNK